MHNTESRLTGLLNALKAIAIDLWNTAESCAPCCGIRLDRVRRADDMPTPGSCCGVRL